MKGKDRVRVHIEQDVPIALLTPQQLALHVEPQSGDPVRNQKTKKFPIFSFLPAGCFPFITQFTHHATCR